jgi:hypothetical protein
MIEKLERNPNVWTLDEACASSMVNKTYILWECKWLLDDMLPSSLIDSNESLN